MLGLNPCFSSVVVHFKGLVCTSLAMCLSEICDNMWYSKMHINGSKLTCYSSLWGKKSHSLSDETSLWKHALPALTAFSSKQESPVWHFIFLQSPEL